MGRIVGKNGFSPFKVIVKYGYIYLFTHTHHMLSEMLLIKYDTKITGQFFNVQMSMIPEYVAPFL